VFVKTAPEGLRFSTSRDFCGLYGRAGLRFSTMPDFRGLYGRAGLRFSTSRDFRREGPIPPAARNGDNGELVSTRSSGENLAVTIPVDAGPAPLPASAGLGRLADVEFKTVIFDMDGTLIDSTPAVHRAWAIWAAEHGLTAADIAGNHGVPSAGVVRAVLPFDRHQGAIDRINELEIADVDGIVVLPGAAEALQSLAAAKNAIATSCTVPLAQARIRAAQLVAPSVLVTADDVKHGKPAPDPFLEAARRLDVDPRRCLVVEDAPKGLQAAHSAGCYTLAVITTTDPADLIADGMVPNLSYVAFDVSESGIRVRSVNS